MARAEVIEEWVARYKSPGNDYDWADAMAVDASGNVYATGRSYGIGTDIDYATVKYDPDGNELWVQRYNGPGNGADVANAIAVDASGNVYVTGESEDSGTGSDYATVKYDTDGNELWVQRYHRSVNSYDVAKAITVDTSGNVYVTGYSSGIGISCDYATVKYDTSGNELWVARYNGLGNEADFAHAIAIDASGNVYVTGGSKGSGTGSDYATVKYDTAGNELWVARYNGPGNKSDFAQAIAVDICGNVYVTGYSPGSGTGYDYYPTDYATVKYDLSGNELWVQRYNGPGNDLDEASAIAVDALGNVYVTGWSAGSGTSADYATVKYDTAGNELWVQRYDGPGSGDDRAGAIAVDASGNVYVTGSSGLWEKRDYATVKYDTDGNELWMARYKGPRGYDRASALGVDASGNVYVTGWSGGLGTGDDYATIKYDTNGNELWVKRYNCPGNGLDNAYAIAVDVSGNVYVTGWSEGSGSVRDYATVKYDTAGTELWGARYNGPGNDHDFAGAIAVDASGSVYVTGWSIGSGTDSDYATIKYDTDGTELWVARYNGPENGDDVADAVAVDASGNVYVTGESDGNGTGRDYATVKYDTDGNELWVRRYNGPESGDDVADAVAVDASGNVYVTGESEGSGTGRDYATVKYDTDGNEVWVKRYDGSGNGHDRANALAVDILGNIYVTGLSPGIETGSDYATIRYDPDGTELWIQRYNGPGNDSDRAYALAVDAAGNVYVTGWSIGIGTGSDYATIKYDPNGTELWVTRYNGPGNDSDFARDIAIDVSGKVYVTGESIGSGTGADYATVQYDTDGHEVWVERYDGPDRGNDRARAIAVDASGKVYVTGGSYDSVTRDDYATLKYSEGLPAGWSMISLPVRPEVPTVANVFPEAVVVYRYQKGAGYVRVQAGENLEVGMGYWILLDKSQPYITEGTEITEYTISVEDGWYMIGGCSLPAEKVVTSGKIVVSYGYTQGVGYQRLPASEPLQPGKGYWILFSNTSEGAEFTTSTPGSQ